MAVDPNLFLLGVCVTTQLGSGDFTNIATNNAADGVYNLNGSPCAIGDIIDLTSPYTSFNPATQIDAGGIKTNGTIGDHDITLALKDPLNSTIIAGGATFVFEFSWALEAYETMELQACEDGGPLSYAGGGPSGSSQYGSPISGTSFDDTITWPAGINKMAITMTATKIVSSVNGGAIKSAVGTVINGSINGIVMAFSASASGRFRSFIVYEPVSDAELPGLSA